MGFFKKCCPSEVLALMSVRCTGGPPPPPPPPLPRLALAALGLGWGRVKNWVEGVGVCEQGRGGGGAGSSRRAWIGAPPSLRRFEMYVHCDAMVGQLASIESSARSACLPACWCAWGLRLDASVNCAIDRMYSMDGWDGWTRHHVDTAVCGSNRAAEQPPYFHSCILTRGSFGSVDSAERHSNKSTGWEMACM
jgi:hypothetical protein